MATISMKELLEAGVHFGHVTRKWHPKMKRYIFGVRNGIHIIDLQHTLREFKKASQELQDTIEREVEDIKRDAQDASPAARPRGALPPPTGPAPPPTPPPASSGEAGTPEGGPDPGEPR